MKLKLLLLSLFLLILIPSVSALPTIREVSQSYIFNLLVLFLVIFFGCFIVLQDVFKSNVGVAIIVSLVIGIVGSVGVIGKYGLLVPRMDIFVLLLIIGLAFFIIRSTFRGGHEAITNIIFFVIPLVWFLFVRDKISYGIQTTLLSVLDMVAGIILIIAIIMFALSLIKPNPHQQGHY